MIRLTTQHPEFQRIHAAMKQRAQAALSEVQPKLYSLALLRFGVEVDKEGHIPHNMAKLVEGEFQSLQNRAIRSFIRREERRLGLNGRYVAH